MAELLRKENNLVSLKFSIGTDAFEKAVAKAFNKNKHRFNIPGFRKGKAPRKIVEKHYGESVFYEDAINIALPDAYEAAVTELALDPVTRPEIDILEMEAGADVVLQADVYVKPAVELGEYKGVTVKVTKKEISDDDVDAELEKERKKNARVVSVDRSAELDDTLIIDYKGSIDGEYFDGGTADNHQLKLGSKQFIGDFEEQLVGCNSGEQKTIEVAFPEDYHVAELAGKPAKFEVTINEIKTEELPELDDEFIKDISEFDTIAEYKADVRKRLEENSEETYKSQIRSAAIDAVSLAALVDIPEVMVENEIDHMLRDFDYQLQYQGMSLEKYYQFTNSTEEDMRNQMKDDAENKVKTSLVIEAIGKAEGIEASEQDVEDELKKMAEAQKVEVDKIKEFYARDEFASIKNHIFSRKVVDFISEHAKLEAE